MMNFIQWTRSTPLSGGRDDRGTSSKSANVPLMMLLKSSSEPNLSPRYRANCGCSRGRASRFSEPRQHTCPICGETMDSLFSEEHRLTHPATATGQIADTKRTPKTKFKTGDVVWIRGYGSCTIKTDRVQRTIIEVKIMTSGSIYYQASNGTNSKGQSIHYYPEKDLTLISPAIPSPKIITLQQPTVRHRKYRNHPKLIANKLCRSRKDIHASIYRLDSKVLEQISKRDYSSRKVKKATPQVPPRQTTRPTDERSVNRPGKHDEPQAAPKISPPPKTETNTSLTSIGT